MIRFFILSMITMVLAAPADLWAWNGSGHKTIASILFRRLSEERREELAELLTHHPRYQEDFVSQAPKTVLQGSREMRADWLLQQASVWPDIVRSGPPEREAFNRPLWHYLPKAFFLTEPPHEFRNQIEASLNSAIAPVGGIDNFDLNGPQAFLANLEVLNDVHTSKAARAVALCWVLHIGQDLHQPCHTSSLYIPDVLPEGDRGANSIKTSVSRNLHAVWDGPLGPDERYEHCRNLAIALLGDAPAESLTQSVGSPREEVERWLQEGEQLERDAVYINEVAAAVSSWTPQKVVEISPDYLRNVRKVADRRVLSAGIRLSELLQNPAAAH